MDGINIQVRKIAFVETLVISMLSNDSFFHCCFCCDTIQQKYFFFIDSFISKNHRPYPQRQKKC